MPQANFHSIIIYQTSFYELYFQRNVYPTKIVKVAPTKKVNLRNCVVDQHYQKITINFFFVVTKNRSRLLMFACRDVITEMLLKQELEENHG